VIRAWEKVGLHNVQDFDRELYGKRPSERLRRRWEDNINMKLREQGLKLRNMGYSEAPDLVQCLQQSQVLRGVSALFLLR
jgi:hypothetical protein